MRVAAVLCVLSTVLLAGCTGKPSAEQRLAAGNELNQSGRPYVVQPGPVSSFPPVDTNFDRLRCHPEGPGTVCERSP